MDMDTLLGRSSIIYIDPCGPVCEFFIYCLRITLFLLVFGFQLSLFIASLCPLPPPMHYPMPPFIIDEDNRHTHP